jgi:hypothetical protein
MRRLQGMSTQVVTLQCRGGDGWSAQRHQFVTVIFTRVQSREELGENDPDRRAPSVSDGDTVTGGRPGSRVKMGQALQKQADVEENIS